jgi:hypothetical protein
MDLIEVLALAARHYKILDLLSIKDYSIPELIKGLEIEGKGTAVRNYIGEMQEAGLVAEENISKTSVPRYNIKITKSGKDTLVYIKKYKKYFTELSIDENTHSHLKEILSLLENPNIADALKEESLNNLTISCRQNPEILTSTELQDYLELYINDLKINKHIDNIFYYCIIKNATQNQQLMEWFSTKLYSRIEEQFKNKSLDAIVRVSRARLIWEVFLWDEERRNECLRSIIFVLEEECAKEDSELCKFIRSSYPNTLRAEIMKELRKLDAKPEIINKLLVNI